MDTGKDWVKRLLCVFLIATVMVLGGAQNTISFAESGLPRAEVDVLAKNDDNSEHSTGDKIKEAATDSLVTNSLNGVAPGVGTFLAVAKAGKEAKEGVEEAKSKFWKSTVGTLAQAMLEGSFQLMQWAMSFWMKYDYSEDTGDAVEGVKNVTWMIAVAAFVASLIVAGMRLAASRRTGFGDGMTEIGVTSFRFLFYCFVMPAAVPAALVASDKLAKVILENFGADFNGCVGEKAAELLTDTDFQGASRCIVGAVSLNINPAETVVGPVIMLLVALVGICGSLMQLVALIVRTFMIPIAAGLLPIFAASAFTSTGKSGLNHLNSYLIAGIIFKPICALLYVVVMWMAKFTGEDGDLMDKAIVAMMFAMVGFTAPSLVRMLVPAAAPAGGGSGSAVMGAGKAAVGAAVGIGATVATGGAAAVAGVGGAAAGAAGGAARGASSLAGGARAAGGAASGGGGVGASLNIGGGNASGGSGAGGFGASTSANGGGAGASPVSGGGSAGSATGGSGSPSGAAMPSVPTVGGASAGSGAGSSATGGAGSPAGAAATPSPAPSASPESQGAAARSSSAPASASGSGSGPASANTGSASSPAGSGSTAGSPNAAETREFPPQSPQGSMPATGEIPRGRGTYAAPGGSRLGNAGRAIRSGASSVSGAVGGGLRTSGRHLRGAASALGRNAISSSVQNVGRNVGQVFSAGEQATTQSVESSSAPHYFGEIGR